MAHRVNRNQNLLGKTMLVLRRPATAVVEVEPAEWMSLREEMSRVVSALDALFQPDHLNFAFLMNADAQVHLHVIPRYASSRLWHGRAFTDDHWGSAFGDEQNMLGVELIQELAAEIRGALPIT